MSDRDIDELKKKLDIVIEQNRQLIEKQQEHAERLKKIEEWQDGTQSFIDKVSGGKMLVTWMLTVFAGAGAIALALVHLIWTPASPGRSH
ncbi:hypothetical protein [Leptospirillum ferriphilum]|uniref:Uncharacterized protein n=1 Tax=Leptospirillum ferriphilum (strain ML-04) TaxID=1048260 RepID=J9ZAL2_LEPFM|nr:hypothetical protein [Leptospirillum ferriphilum]AFS52908.1 hypothetical protein LFML04_0673 [Leptospirillum ferriphilum ML-04]